MPASELPVPEPSRGEVGERIDEILSRAEFGDTRSLIERLFDWVFERIGDVVEAIVQGPGDSLTAWALTIGLAALATYVIVRSTRELRLDPKTRLGAAMDGPTKSATDWTAEAIAHEQAGQWRQAVRCRYRALVADLAEHGLVEEVPGRTAGEYRRQVDLSVPAGSSAFASVTALFERAWYGQGTTGPEEAKRFDQLAEQLRALMATHGESRTLRLASAMGGRG